MRPHTIVVGLVGWCGGSLLLAIVMAAAGLDRIERERARARYIDTEAEAFANEVERYDREHAP